MFLSIKYFLSDIKVFIKKALFERFEYSYITIKDQVVPLNDSKIPNVVYQTWVNTEVPWRMGNEIKKFRDLNYDHSFYLYSHEKRDDYMKTNWFDHPIYSIYKNLKFHASKADVFRYCILYEKGGFYFDIKSACKMPLSKLNSLNKEAIISYESNINLILPDLEHFEKLQYPCNLIQQWAMGFKKNHILLMQIIENIVKYSSYFKGKKFSNPKLAILALTGPGMFSKSFFEYCSSENSNLEQFHQAGISFNGEGIFSIKGSEFRYRQSIAYNDVLNSIILS